MLLQLLVGAVMKLQHGEGGRLDRSELVKLFPFLNTMHMHVGVRLFGSKKNRFFLLLSFLDVYWCVGSDEQ